MNKAARKRPGAKGQQKDADGVPRPCEPDPAAITAGAELTAIVATNAGVNAAGIIKTFGESAFGHMDGGLQQADLWNAIAEKSAKINSGEMTEVESMLYAQSLALQSMFMNLSRRAASQEYLPQFEAHMRLALKAQSQCRTTLEALFEMKHPRPVAFVQQANIANGPQQVNNAPLARERAEIPVNPSNELLAVTHEEGERLDTGTLRAAAQGDSEMASVAASHRPKKSRR